LAWKSPFVGKITGLFRLQFPLSLLEVSRVVGDVGPLGGASVNFQSKVSTISLNGCVTSGGISLRGPTEEEEVMECLLSFHAESFVLQLVIQKFKEL
jgi:hypothetical protein